MNMRDDSASRKSSDADAQLGATTPRVTLKGAVIAEIVAANPKGRLKAVEYGSFGEIKRVEWHDEPEATDAD